MATEQTRNDVWRGLLEVARLVRYYEKPSDRQRRNRLVTPFLLLGAAGGGIAALLDLLPTNMQLLASGMIALLVVWDFVADYAKKAAILHTIGLECSALESEWRELWANVNEGDLNEDEARRGNQQLERRMLAVTGRAGYADVREDRKLNEKCEKAAYKVVAERYAAWEKAKAHRATGATSRRDQERLHDRNRPSRGSQPPHRKREEHVAGLAEGPDARNEYKVVGALAMRKLMRGEVPPWRP